MESRFLTLDEREGLLLQHRKEHEKRVADRIKVVLLRDDGWSFAEIAAALFLSDEGVRNHFEDYKGSKKLMPENGGSEPMLSEFQIAELLAHLDEKLYAKAEDICAYVEQRFCIKYSISGLTELIKRRGFTYHQPCGVPKKADADLQKEFLKKYTELKENLDENDHIIFIDGVHPTHVVRFVRGWIRRGVRREIPTNGSQRRINILGALNLQTMQVFRQEYDTLDSANAIMFFTYLLGAIPSGIVNIILDQGRYFNCKAIGGFAAANPRICLHYLPSYSPNLNVIERLWKIMHEHTTNNIFHENFKSFTEKIREFFDKTFPENIEKFHTRLTDNFRIMGNHHSPRNSPPNLPTLHP